VVGVQTWTTEGDVCLKISATDRGPGVGAGIGGSTGVEDANGVAGAVETVRGPGVVAGVVVTGAGEVVGARGSTGAGDAADESTTTAAIETGVMVGVGATTRESDWVGADSGTVVDVTIGVDGMTTGVVSPEVCGAGGGGGSGSEQAVSNKAPIKIKAKSIIFNISKLLGMGFSSMLSEYSLPPVSISYGCTK
jgi:hypothetical protein